MRKYLRAIARANMKKAGIEKINKKHKYKGMPAKSKFAENWKKFAAMPAEIRKTLKQEQAKLQKQREARKARREKLRAA